MEVSGGNGMKRQSWEAFQGTWRLEGKKECNGSGETRKRCEDFSRCDPPPTGHGHYRRFDACQTDTVTETERQDSVVPRYEGLSTDVLRMPLWVSY
ncbi:hypothetical protein NC652_012917 [Populus alba x Populus x berolinensis]|nr:hypothetical protein NC652_012917 [Populus alba x Populus x berolinensis]